jgi:A/G-specific adenine glycosylase
VSELRAALGAWFAREKRDLPWRRARPDPYAVWVSEVMLQQTTVAAVVPFFVRFMRRFPTIEALAQAPLDAVLEHWAGLGYYRRARHLHAGAREVARVHGGELPADATALLALPGIGPYTAGAIASIAFDLPAALVDGNVARVLSRLFMIPGDPKTGATKRRLWETAGSILPRRGAGDHNQALMELGALVCTPDKPACERCPVAAHCAARREGSVDRFPELAPRALVRARRDLALAFAREGALLLARRRSDAVWGGLWELPRVTLLADEPDADAARRLGREILGCAVSLAGLASPIASARHVVMREKIELRVLTGRLKGEPLARAHDELRWARPGEFATLALPSPQRKVAPAVLAWLTEPGT